MSKHCINHLRITYDCCRSCSGKDNDCPEYLDGKFEYRVYHSRQTKPIQHSLKQLSLDNYDGSIPFKEGQDKTADTYNLSRQTKPPLRTLEGEDNSHPSRLDKTADTYIRQIKPYIDNARVIDVNEERRTKPAEKYTLPIKRIVNHPISFLHKWAEIYDNRFYRRKLIQRRKDG
jgi:hypothetical protein